jgi:hypothetical protein
MRLAPLLLLGACPRPLDPEQPCEEIAYAIGARTEECTGDGELGEVRIEAFRDGYVCVDTAEPGVDGGPMGGDDGFACALVLRNVACEIAVDAGDDLAAWLRASPSCALAVAPVGETPQDTGGLP